MTSDGRVAWITGAASGLGKAAAMLLALNDVHVAALDTDEAELEKLQKTWSGNGTLLTLVADVGDEAQMRRAAHAIDKHFGRLDIVFANAGINGVWGPIDELTAEAWDRTLGINLRGTFLTVKFALGLLKRRGGSIVITSSVNGTRMFANTGATAYACSKAGQVTLAKMLALELARHRIRVNVICPGAIDTAIDTSTDERDLDRIREPVEFPEGEIPLTDGNPGSAEQVARLVRFLTSEDASHITGTEIYIDGGQSLLHG